jgi:hypothetical protein
MSGAQALLRLLPNRPCTAAVSTTTAAAEANGSGVVGLSTSSSPEGKPCATSAACMTGSQATSASRLTCRTTQATVSLRAAAAWRSWAAVGGWTGERVKYRTTATDSKAARTAITAGAARRLRRRRRPSFFATPRDGDVGRPVRADVASCFELADQAPAGLVVAADWTPSRSVTSSSSWMTSGAALATGLGPATRSDSGPSACLRFPLILLAGRAVTSPSAAPGAVGPPGGQVVSSRSWMLASARSALTAACMRRRNSSDSGEDDGADTGGAARVAPLNRCGSSLPCSSSAMQYQTP